MFRHSDLRFGAGVCAVGFVAVSDFELAALATLEHIQMPQVFLAYWLLAHFPQGCVCFFPRVVLLFAAYRATL